MREPRRELGRVVRAEHAVARLEVGGEGVAVPEVVLEPGGGSWWGAGGELMGRGWGVGGERVAIWWAVALLVVLHPGGDVRGE